MKNLFLALAALVLLLRGLMAQTINFQSTDRLEVVTNLATAQGPNLVNNDGTVGATNPNYLQSVANRHVLLLTGADTGTGAAAAVDQHGRLTATNAIPVAPHFQVPSPGLWIKGKAGTTFVPSNITIAYEFFRFSGGSWVRWSTTGGPPSFSATLNIANESRVVRDLAGNPLSDQNHGLAVSAVTYIPVFWFGEANRSVLESQKVSLRMTMTIPSTKDGVTTTEKFVRMFTPFDFGDDIQAPCVTVTPQGESWKLEGNLPPPMTGTSGTWIWETSTTLQSGSWSPVVGTGTIFSMVVPDTSDTRRFWRAKLALSGS